LGQAAYLSNTLLQSEQQGIHASNGWQHTQMTAQAKATGQAMATKRMNQKIAKKGLPAILKRTFFD
jgi:hypothetical protein